MFPPRRLDGLVLVLAAAMSGASASPLREAPDPVAPVVDQLAIAGNACGPAALLNAYRTGNRHWQRAAESVPGATDQARLRSIILNHGGIASAHLPGRPRWSRDGINVADLCDIANELNGTNFLPLLSHEVLFMQPRESPARLLRRVHRQLEASLAKGFPPVLAIRRYVHRKGPDGTAQWVTVEGHFVTLNSLPRRLDRHALSFPVSYIDPWGGRRCEGVIAIAGGSFLASPGSPAACLEAVFPQALVGDTRVRRGETTAIGVVAMIGRR